MENKTTKSKHQSALFAFFLAQLKDVYWAEKELVTKLPEIAERAVAADLRTALTEHATETRKQMERLEKVFGLLDEKVVAETCKAMDGLLAETKQQVEAIDQESLTRDVAVIACTQKIEHYEIATYGTLKTLAMVLKFPEEVSRLLAESLKEEKAADERLTSIAESHVNQEAEQE